ncbi:glycerophosphodiester phosphodiesterase family protein [Marmoricola sp. URHB0036]|uniref:glycerophosphodiester phosphodiesterase family protein n=1 Tax=Marmoricola sp. URHB0036 TaxID=1298863 RepID=UPI0006867FC7|nr:glycerophosphodiester phosphodiesterase family protein [Marmoricola sp. URHB0036]
MTGPLVIGHRGASGHRPEHTALAYQLAWRSGADSVEPDVVCTRDGILVCRHDLDLAPTTDVATRPEFASKRRTMEVDGEVVDGWFVQDFFLEELKELRARERWPKKRPGSAMYDDLLPVLTLEELLDLREQESARAGRPLGVHIEIKHAALFRDLRMPLHESLVAILRERRLDSSLGPVSVMSFEAEVLKQLRRDLQVEMVQLVDEHDSVRFRRMQKIGGYASAVGLSKHLVLPRDAAGNVGEPGPGVQASFRAGLDVLVWTLRSENSHLPANLRSGGPAREHGDAATEVSRLLDLGVDGLVTDFPEVAASVRADRVGAIAL